MRDDRPITNTENENIKSQIGSKTGQYQQVLSFVQLAMNIIFVSIFLYMGYSVIKVIQKDVDMKLEIEILRHMRKVEQCKHNYEINECRPDMRVRALDELCEEWLHCINLEGMQGVDSKFSLRRGVLWAETFAEVINAFVSSIHIRTWFILLSTTIICVYMANMVFRWL